MKETKVSQSNITLAGLIQLAFIILKLCNVINWSWWWVLSPMWIELGIAVIMATVILIVDAIAKRK